MSAPIAELLARAPAVRACREALGATAGRLDRRRRDPRRGPGQRGQGPRPGRRRRRAGGRPGDRPRGRRARVPALGRVRHLARPGGGRRLARRRQPGCAATESRRTWRSATSRSTRSRSRWQIPMPRRSTRTAGSTTSSRGVLRAVSDAQLRRRPAADPARRSDRRGPGARDRSRRPRLSPARRPSARASRRASASSPSCACCSLAPTR